MNSTLLIYVLVFSGLLIVVPLILIKSPVKSSKREVGYKGLIDFLEEADDAYILSHQTKQISYFSRYACDSVCTDLLDLMRSQESKLFGTKSYRERTWSVLSEEGESILVKKELTHKHVKIRKGVHVAIGEDMKEHWRIRRVKDSFTVMEIA